MPYKYFLQDKFTNEFLRIQLVFTVNQINLILKLHQIRFNLRKVFYLVSQYTGKSRCGFSLELQPLSKSHLGEVNNPYFNLLYITRAILRHHLM